MNRRPIQHAFRDTTDESRSEWLRRERQHAQEIIPTLPGQLLRAQVDGKRHCDILEMPGNGSRGKSVHSLKGVTKYLAMWCRARGYRLAVRRKEVDPHYEDDHKVVHHYHYMLSVRL